MLRITHYTWHRRKWFINYIVVNGITSDATTYLTVQWIVDVLRLPSRHSKIVIVVLPHGTLVPIGEEFFITGDTRGLGCKGFR